MDIPHKLQSDTFQCGPWTHSAAVDLLTDIKRFVTSVLLPEKNVYGKGGAGMADDPLEKRAAQCFAQWVWHRDRGTSLPALSEEARFLSRLDVVLSLVSGWRIIR